MGEVRDIRNNLQSGDRVLIPSDQILLAAQYFAFYKDDPDTGSKLLRKVQQTGLVGLYTPFYAEDAELHEKLQVFAEPGVLEKARADLFNRKKLG